MHQRPGLLRTPLRDKLPRGRLSPDPESPLATAPSSLAQRYEPTPTALSPGAAPTGPHGCGPRPSQQRRHLETCRMVRPTRKGIKRSPNTFKAISRFAKHPNVRFRPIPITRYWLQAVLRLKGSLTSLSPREGTCESATPNQPLTSGHARAPTQAPRSQFFCKNFRDLPSTNRVIPLLSARLVTARAGGEGTPAEEAPPVLSARSPTPLLPRGHTRSGGTCNSRAPRTDTQTPEVQTRSPRRRAQATEPHAGRRVGKKSGGGSLPCHNGLSPPPPPTPLSVGTPPPRGGDSQTFHADQKRRRTPAPLAQATPGLTSPLLGLTDHLSPRGRPEGGGARSSKESSAQVPWEAGLGGAGPPAGSRPPAAPSCFLD